MNEACVRSRVEPERKVPSGARPLAVEVGDPASRGAAASGAGLMGAILDRACRSRREPVAGNVMRPLGRGRAPLEGRDDALDQETRAASTADASRCIPAFSASGRTAPNPSRRPFAAFARPEE